VCVAPQVINVGARREHRCAPEPRGAARLKAGVCGIGIVSCDSHPYHVGLKLHRRPLSPTRNDIERDVEVSEDDSCELAEWVRRWASSCQ
jgi:hypothetical protein